MGLTFDVAAFKNRVDGRDLNPMRGCTKRSPGCKHCYAEASPNDSGSEGHPFDEVSICPVIPNKLARARPLGASHEPCLSTRMSDLVPRPRSRQVRRDGGYHHAPRELAHISGSDETSSSASGNALRPKASERASGRHIRWGVWSGSEAWTASYRPPPGSPPARSRFLSVEPLLGGPRDVIDADRNPLGNCRRRKWA